MTMNIKSDPRNKGQRMIDMFGEPSISTHIHNELIGYYFMGDREYYWYHDVEDNSWEVWHEVENDSPMSFGLESAEEAKKIEKTIDHLRHLTPPSPPLNLDVRSSSTPFMHEGQLFAWMFFPELRRWELAPLGRA